jgi:PIN domain nuclease of toxin-antitoxin system
MRALLDTHAFLWWNTNDPQLSDTARGIIANGQNEVYLSAASAWEIAIKAARGRLILPDTPERYVSQRLARHRFLALPVQISHALHVAALPWHHADPFDRLLIAQSQLEQLPLITADEDIVRYDVQVIW